MSFSVFWAASADLMARFLTSSATTANPEPASPARAASTAAFRASRFVWKAISWMVLMILPMLSLAADVSCKELINAFIEAFPSARTCSVAPISLFPSLLFSVFFFIIDDISSMDEEVSSTALACSLAPSANCMALSSTIPIVLFKYSAM